MTAIMTNTPATPARSKKNSAAKGMTAPATLPMPLTTEVPMARTEVGNSSGDQTDSIVLSIMVKNWKIMPSTRISAVVLANDAKQMAEMQPSTAATVTVSRRGALPAR